MLSLLRLERKQKNYSNPFRIRIFLFLSHSFGIETINTFIHSVVPPKPFPIPDQNGQSLYPFSDKNGAKTLPDGASHTYIAYIREYFPGFEFDLVHSSINNTGGELLFSVYYHV